MLWFLAVAILCFFSLGKKNPLKWFRETRMKNIAKDDKDPERTNP